MKKWACGLAVLLAAAAFLIIYRFSTPGRSSQQLKLWYVSGDFSPAVMELLAGHYNEQRRREDYPVSLQAFATEEELAAAFAQSRPDLLLCSYDRAASLGSREQLAELVGADWDYLPEIEDSLPYAGRSFFPLGSAVPLLVVNDGALAEAGIQADFASLEGLCATAEAYYEQTGKPFFTAGAVSPMLAVWCSSLGYELHGDMERDALSEVFCRVYNQLAQCAYDGCFLPPLENFTDYVETGELPCALISSTQAVSLADGCTLALLPLPEGGEAVYVPELMGLAVTGANSYALPSAKAFILWLRDNYSPWDALALGLVPAGTAMECEPDLELSRLLMAVHESRRPLLYPPLSGYMENRREMEDRLCHALDLLY
ncbi:MAG: hypothetical protein ACI4O0_01570 [Candidatus Limivicinus sp.]